MTPQLGFQGIERALAHLPSWRSARNKGLGALTITATKDGYTFGGWNIGGTTYPVGASFTISTVDVAPAAVWNAATYSVTYNGNGATGGTTPNGGTFTTGGSYSAASNTGSLVLLEPNHSAMLGKR